MAAAAVDTDTGYNRRRVISRRSSGVRGARLRPRSVHEPWKRHHEGGSTLCIQ
jgi:hypothetical protein